MGSSGSFRQSALGTPPLRLTSSPCIRLPECVTLAGAHTPLRPGTYHLKGLLVGGEFRDYGEQTSDLNRLAEDSVNAWHPRR